MVLVLVFGRMILLIRCINGLPGYGKNVYATYLAKKHFRRTNNLLFRVVRRIQHKPTFINNVYTTYPILLKKFSKRSRKKPIFSNKVTLYDLNNDFSFLKDSLIIIDEVQAFYDSEEYKDFPKMIGTFCQFHRHFGIKDILFISQHPSRIVKKIRVLACEFDKIRIFFHLPFVPFAFIYYSRYFEFDDYGKYHHPKKEAKTYDVKNRFSIFFTSSVFKSYNSKYLRVLNESKPLYSTGTFDSLHLSSSDIKLIYRGLDESVSDASSVHKNVRFKK